MGQDIREMFKNEDSGSKEKLNRGHQNRFEAKLDKTLPVERSGNNYLFLKIAAVLVVAIGIGLFFFNSPGNQDAQNQSVASQTEDGTEETIIEKQFQLSDVSPEFKKIENYYLAGINMELAKLEINNDNKALIDSFMLQME